MVLVSGARLGVQSIKVEDCQGTMHGAEDENVQLLSCQPTTPTPTTSDKQDDDGWAGDGSDFLVMALDVVSDEEDAESAKRVSSRLRAGCVHVGLSLAAVARLQSFVTTVVSCCFGCEGDSAFVDPNPQNLTSEACNLDPEP
eukprot:3554063-Rhodomonas_salina.3